jgi:tetratricopeptide (TPR) repeat protein
MPVKHVPRLARAWLAAAGLILIAGTPAVLAAAGVSNPWTLAGATAIAAVIVLSCGKAEPRYHRRAESAAPAGAAEAPPYIPRDLDGELRERLAAGGFVLLVGDAAAGKTRMVVEAIQATLPDHTLIAPVEVADIRAAINQAADSRCSVLWLDDLQRFLGPGGITAADVGWLLDGSGHHRVIAATIRAAEQVRLTAELRADDRTGHGPREVRAVLDRAQQVRIARLFTTSEMERCAARDWDPRIAEANRHADRYGIAEYIAAGPALLRDWEDARNSSTGAHARGAAIVTAAIDIRRAGYLSPIPRDLLDQVHEHYLADAEHAGKSREPLAEAWTWATAQRSATTGLLNPVGKHRVTVFGYLTDTVQRRAGPLDKVLEPVVRSALACASAADAVSLARTAHNQARCQLAADAWRIACRRLASDPGVGQEHPDTLASRHDLALALRDLGRLEEAEAEHRAVLEIRQRALGPGHPGTLASRDGLAQVLRDLGRLDEAAAEHRAILEVRRRVLEPDHPDTIASRSNLALVLGAAGRLDDAEAQHRAVLEIRQRVLGPDHSDTIASRNSLALVLGAAGRLDEAEAEHRAVLETTQRMLGPRHLSTLGSRNNLAGVLRDMGRLAEAEAEIRSVLAARQLALGPDHPDTLTSRNNLVRVLCDMGWLDEAEAEIRAVLAIRLRVLGPDHPSTLASRNTLAGVLHERGRLDEAESEVRAVLAVMLRVLGPHHPDTLASRNNLALVLRDLGRLDEAEPEQRDVVASAQQVLSPDDAGTVADGLLVTVDAGAEAEMITQQG